MTLDVRKAASHHCSVLEIWDLDKGLVALVAKKGDEVVFETPDGETG